MKNIEISLPKDLAQYLHERVSEAGYGSASEYVQALIIADQQLDEEAIEERLMAGLEGSATPMTPEDWLEIRQQAEQGADGPNRKAPLPVAASTRAVRGSGGRLAR